MWFLTENSSGNLWQSQSNPDPITCTREEVRRNRKLGNKNFMLDAYKEREKLFEEYLKSILKSKKEEFPLQKKIARLWYRYQKSPNLAIVKEINNFRKKNPFEVRLFFNVYKVNTKE